MPALLRMTQDRKSYASNSKKNSLDMDSDNVAGRSPIVQRIVISMEKKIRNLEKRKNKLKQAENNLKAGKPLTEDQKKAVQQLNQVEMQIDFAGEILRNVVQIVSANETMPDNSRESDYFDVYGNCKENNDDMQKLLTIQSALHCLGEETVRRKFLSGVEGALKLTNDQLALLDETYHKLNPIRYNFMDRNEWNWSVTESAKFIRSLLGFSRSICFRNTTFRDLRTLLDEIVACPYFDRRIRSTGSSDSGASISTLSSPGNAADNQSSVTRQSPENGIAIDDLEESNHIVIQPLISNHNADISSAELRRIDNDVTDGVGVSSPVLSLPPVPATIYSSLPQIFYTSAPSIISMVENTGHVAPNVIAADLPRAFALPQMPLSHLPPFYAIEQPLQVLPITQMPFIGPDIENNDGLIYDDGIVEPKNSNWIDSGSIVDYTSAYETNYQVNSEPAILEYPLETAKPLNPDAPEFVSRLATLAQANEANADNADLTNQPCEATLSNQDGLASL